MTIRNCTCHAFPYHPCHNPCPSCERAIHAADDGGGWEGAGEDRWSDGWGAMPGDALTAYPIGA